LVLSFKRKKIKIIFWSSKKTEVKKGGLAFPVILLLNEHEIYAGNTNNNKSTKA